MHSISPSLPAKVNRARYARIIFLILYDIPRDTRANPRDRKIAGTRNNADPVRPERTGNAMQQQQHKVVKMNYFIRDYRALYRPRCVRVHALFPLSEIEFIEISTLTGYRPA